MISCAINHDVSAASGTVATTMTASLTGLPNYHSGFDLPFALVKHTIAADAFWAPETDPRAFSQRCADELERLVVEMKVQPPIVSA